MDLMRGSKGEEVEKLQRQLKKLGLYRGAIDGIFGKGSFAGIRAFQERYLVDGIATPYLQKRILEAIQEWDDLGEALFPVPRGLQEVEETYGKIEYEDGNPQWGDGKGWVTITNNWRSEYLKKEQLPIVDKKYHVNRVVLPSIERVLTVIENRGLGGEIKQFGCWAPRHQMHNPKNPLSVHTWAAAVDINWDDNGVGTGHGTIDSGIVEIFEAHGWTWGGRWRTSDPMHFQLCTGY